MSSNTATPAPGAKPLSFMEKLGPLVSLYRPSEASSTSTDHGPRLIIIAGWTDARDAHVAKYIIKYQALYPAAQILLLKSTMSCIWSPSQIGPGMKVAASVVRNIFQTPSSSSSSSSSSSPSLLIHILSNGGSSSIANLYEQYAATAGPNDDKHLPPHATIFDSSPGQSRIPCAVAFVSVGLPLYQQIIAAPFLYALAAFWSASMSLGLLANALDSWYKSHNHNPSNSAEVRRVYIYSPIDVMVDYRDIEAHAAEAKNQGFCVSTEKFEKSEHVTHARTDEKRYWEIVRRAMEGS